MRLRHQSGWPRIYPIQLHVAFIYQHHVEPCGLQCTCPHVSLFDWCPQDQSQLVSLLYVSCRTYLVPSASSATERTSKNSGTLFADSDSELCSSDNEAAEPLREMVVKLHYDIAGMREVIAAMRCEMSELNASVCFIVRYLIRVF